MYRKLFLYSLHRRYVNLTVSIGEYNTKENRYIETNISHELLQSKVDYILTQNYLQQEVQ